MTMLNSPDVQQSDAARESWEVWREGEALAGAAEVGRRPPGGGVGAGAARAGGGREAGEVDRRRAGSRSTRGTVAGWARTVRPSTVRAVSTRRPWRTWPGCWSIRPVRRGGEGLREADRGAVEADGLVTVLVVDVRGGEGDDVGEVLAEQR